MNEPPPIVLISGREGTGKSTLINAIITHAEKLGVSIAATAENNLNASDIGGVAISSLFKDGFDNTTNWAKTKTKSTKKSQKIKPQAVAALKNLFPVNELLLLIIDGISNVSTQRIACLSKHSASARGKENESFGGINILLAGAFNQKGPCAASLATSDIMK